MKYSIIVPVYNVEEYIKKCIDSILNQTYKDFELIIVNDGSTDKSKAIIDSYNDNRIKVRNQKNQGLSVARNNGLKEAINDYILFVDSDDYIEEDLLDKINTSLSNNPDIVRFQVRKIFNDDKKEYLEQEFYDFSGGEAFKTILNFHYVENAWCYAYKREYLIKNNYSFEPNCYHEDYGLIPLTIIKANKVNCINFLGYNYIQRNGSIMNNASYEKVLKKANDTFYQYKKIINLDSNPIYKSFLANSLILKLKDLNNEDYNTFLKELKKEKVFDNILSDTITRKIKKLILKFAPNIYIKIFK